MNKEKDKMIKKQEIDKNMKQKAYSREIDDYFELIAYDELKKVQLEEGKTGND